MTVLTIDGYAIGRAVEKTTDGYFYAVWPLDLPGCIAQGHSMPAAINRLRAILPAYVAAQQKRGIIVPAPNKKVPSATFAFFRMDSGSASSTVPESELWAPVPVGT